MKYFMLFTIFLTGCFFEDKEEAVYKYSVTKVENIEKMGTELNSASKEGWEYVDFVEKHNLLVFRKSVRTD